VKHQISDQRNEGRNTYTLEELQETVRMLREALKLPVMEDDSEAGDNDSGGGSGGAVVMDTPVTPPWVALVCFAGFAVELGAVVLMPGPALTRPVVTQYTGWLTFLTVQTNCIGTLYVTSFLRSAVPSFTPFFLRPSLLAFLLSFLFLFPSSSLCFFVLSFCSSFRL
jgi:hypothetical protein